MVDALKARAKQNKRSLEAEIRMLLSDVAQTGEADLATRPRRPDRGAHPERAADGQHRETDSTELVREDRAR